MGLVDLLPHPTPVGTIRQAGWKYSDLHYCIRRRGCGDFPAGDLPHGLVQGQVVLVGAGLRPAIKEALDVLERLLRLLGGQ